MAVLSPFLASAESFYFHVLRAVIVCMLGFTSREGHYRHRWCALKPSPFITKLMVNLVLLVVHDSHAFLDRGAWHGDIRISHTYPPCLATLVSYVCSMPYLLSGNIDYTMFVHWPQCQARMMVLRVPQSLAIPSR